MARWLAPLSLLGNNGRMENRALLLRLCTLLLILAVVGGCTKVHKPIPASVDEMIPSAVVAETATIEGKVHVISRYGEMHTGADSTVYLVPVTAYATEWFDRYIVQQQKFDGKDPRSFPSAHATVVDFDGHFEFQTVPPGAYYVICNVHYPHRGLKIGRFHFSLRTVETVEAYAKTHVAADQKAEVLVTR
jgi:hypothetical protein